MTSKPNTDNAGQAKEGHSSEPWSIGLIQKNLIFNADDELIAEAPCNKVGVTEGVANAARIVQCVNFCAGQSNLNLETLVLSKLSLTELIDVSNRFRQERDDAQRDLASLRSQLSDAKAKVDWVDKHGPELVQFLESKGMNTVGYMELRAILSSDGKAKEGGV